MRPVFGQWFHFQQTNFLVLTSLAIPLIGFGQWFNLLSVDKFPSSLLFYLCH